MRSKAGLTRHQTECRVQFVDEPGDGIGLSDRFETGPSATGNSGIGIVIIAGLERSGRRVYTGPVLARR